jgi:zinc protease
MVKSRRNLYDRSVTNFLGRYYLAYNRCVSIVAILLALLTTQVLSDEAGTVSSTTLPSGMKVIVREGHVANLAAVEIWVRAGSINESDANNGVSHFVEHMIFKATSKYGPGQIDREIEGLGAELNGGTSKDWVHFYTTVASEYLPTALEVLADAVVNAQFRPEDIDKERQVILDEIAQGENDPSHRAYGLFSQAAFAVHPYRLPPMGTRESVGRLSRDDLVAYYNRYYTPGNMCVVIAGDVKKSDALSLVQRVFSGFSRPTFDVPTAPAEPKITEPRVRSVKTDSNQTYVIVGYQVPGCAAFRECCALDVILEILGDDHRGRISAALTAQGIKFSKSGAEFVTQREPTYLYVLAAVDPADADKAASVLLQELRRLAEEPPSPGELLQAKRLVEGGDLFEQETYSGQARALGQYESIASFDLALKHLTIVREITAEEVRSVAEKYFGTENYCRVTIGPESKG